MNELRMQRSPAVEPPRAERGSARTPSLALALAWATLGCPAADGDRPGPTPAVADAAKGPPASAPTVEAGDAGKAGDAAKAPEAATPPAGDSPPEGWTRLDLATVGVGLTGTIDLPPGVTAEAGAGQEVDAEGLEAEVHRVQLGPRGRGATLETIADLPPRFASADAMARFHANFEHVSTHELAPDHWAVVQRWRPGECMLHGWSAAAGLSCSVFKAPCDQMEQWVRVCDSLRAGPAPNESRTTPKSAFPMLDEAAAEVAVTVARAVARDDEPRLRGAIGPAGLKIGNETYTPESLEAALADKSVLQLVAPTLYDPKAEPGSSFNWNGELGEGGKATVWFSSGYGEQPYFELNETADGWRLVEFGVVDLGEP